MYIKIQTGLVSGDYPGNRAGYRNTQYVKSLDLYVGEYDGPVQAEHLSYTGEWPIKNYRKEMTFDEFKEFFSIDNWIELVELVEGNATGRHIFQTMQDSGVFPIGNDKVIDLLNAIDSNTGIDTTEVRKGVSF